MAMLVFVLVICLFSWSAASVRRINYTIEEETGADFLIGNPATDAGLITDNLTERIEYSVLTEGNPDANLFHVNSRTSGLFTAVNLDSDVICQFRNPCLLQFFIVANSQFDNFFEKLSVSVLLKDINDNEPKFPQNDMFLEVSENSELGTSVPIDSAIDNDTGNNSVQMYFIDSPQHVPFTLEVQDFSDGRTLVRLVVDGLLDRERTAQYSFRIVAVDGGQPPKTGSTSLHVRIMDKNDNSPKFSSPEYNVTIDEDIPLNSVILKLNASDLDEGENGRVLYRLSSHQSETVQKIFRIDSKTGELTVIRNFIDEASQFYRIIVEASDNATQPLISQTQVFVGIRDTHNKGPEITLNLFSDTNYAEVSEGSAIGTVLAIVSVSDPDSGDNGRINCSLNDDTFTLMQPDLTMYEYNIELHKQLDREKIGQYSVILTCHDYGTPNLQAQKMFEVRVIDVNDNPPKFTEFTYYVTVAENEIYNNSILQVLATDPDDPQSMITYSLGLSIETLGYFSIVPSNGKITLTKVLDREDIDKLSFKVFASDNGNPSLTGTALVEVIIEDENDNFPVFDSSHFEFVIPEDQSRDTFIGIVTAKDLDYGDNAKLSFTITSQVVPFWVDDKGSIYTTRTLDRESNETYVFGVNVRDHGSPSLSSKTNVTVTIKDVNDNQPIITYPDSDDEMLYVSRDQLPNVPIAQIKAIDTDAGINSKLSFYLLNNNDSRLFDLQEHTGELFVNRELSPQDKGTYDLHILVRDNGIPSLSRTRRLSVLVGDNLDRLSDESTSGPIRYYAIAIAISCVTIVLSILIILAIVLIRRKDQRRGKYQESVSSNSTMETMADSSNPDIHINGTYSREVIRTALTDKGQTIGQISTDQDKQILEPDSQHLQRRMSSPSPKKPEVISESVSIWEWTENDGTLEKRLKSRTDPRIHRGDNFPHQNHENTYPTYPSPHRNAHQEAPLNYYPSFTTFRPGTTDFQFDFPQYTEDV